MSRFSFSLSLHQIFSLFLSISYFSLFSLSMLFLISFSFSSLDLFHFLLVFACVSTVFLVSLDFLLYCFLISSFSFAPPTFFCFWEISFIFNILYVKRIEDQWANIGTPSMIKVDKGCIQLQFIGTRFFFFPVSVFMSIKGHDRFDILT